MKDDETNSSFENSPSESNLSWFFPNFEDWIKENVEEWLEMVPVVGCWLPRLIPTFNDQTKINNLQSSISRKELTILIQGLNPASKSLVMAKINLKLRCSNFSCLQSNGWRNLDYWLPHYSGQSGGHVHHKRLRVVKSIIFSLFLLFDLSPVHLLSFLEN